MTITRLQHVRVRTRILMAVAALGTALVTAVSTLPMPAAQAAISATWVRQIGRPGHAGLYAWGAATAVDGSILVGDYNNYNIKRFSPAGRCCRPSVARGVVRARPTSRTAWGSTR